MNDTYRLLLVRHCEASGQQPDAPLTDTGRGQARALARFLSGYPVDRVVASSCTRARQSVEPFAAGAGLEVHLDERLVEQTLAGRPVADWRQAIRDGFADPDFRLPGGESGRDVLERGWAALEELLGGGHRLPVVVTHGKFLSVLLSSLDADFGYEGWRALSNPDVFALVKGRGGAWMYERIWRAG